MDQRYQLFKSDVHFETNSSPASTGGYQYTNSPHSATPSQKIGGLENWSQNTPKWKQVLGEDVSKVPSSTSQSALLLQNSQQTAVCQLTTILNSSNILRTKCDQISQMLSGFSNKELIEIYPQLLMEIFAFSGNEIFGLNIYDPRKHFYEFNAAFNFLSTSGCLFKIINKLMADQDAEFHFPYKGLPAGITEKISSGHVSLWHQKKLTVTAGNEVVLACNALEYYLLLFAYYIIHPHTLQKPSQWSGIEDILYIRLLEEYLKYFFPFDVTKNSTLTNSPESKPSSPSTLWKTTSPSQSEGNPATASLQHILPASYSEVFLQILSDIWFGLNREKQTEQEQEYKLPSVDHARVVRILVKYLHTFINGSNDLQMILFSFSHNQQLEELKSVVIPALMNKSLYIYLQHCFTHWPLDASFRMVLETWLSFIQPWRYRDTSNNKTMNDESVDMDLSPWRPFILENMLFYSTLFQMFLLRALRFDMTSLHDVQLVYRVAKVFSQASLSELLQNENEPEQLATRPLGGPMFLGLMSTSKKIQLEKPGEVLPSIFDHEVTKNVKDLCQILATNVIAIRKKNSSVESKKSTGIIASIKEFFLIDDTTDFDRDREQQKLIDYLDQSCHLLCTTFKLPALQTEPSTPGENSADLSAANLSGTSVNYMDETLPEFTITENGVQLTDVGRYQILQGMRQFPITYSGDPELQPIRSYESELAVKGLYWLSTRMNEKYSDLLDKLYNQPGYMSRCLRKFSKRLHKTQYLDTPFHLPQSPQLADKVAPRISLRFASSYYFMGYACWVVIIARLFGFNWLFIIFAVIVFAAICIIAHIDSPPKKFKSN